MSENTDTWLEVDHKPKRTNMKLEIKLNDLVHQEVMHYTNKSDFEVSGLGKVVIEEEDGSTVLRVTKVVLLPQKNTHTHTEIDPAAVGRAEYQLRNEPGELRWWFHSHVNMATFWSSEDLETIAQLASNGWFCATVFNQRDEVLSAYEQSSPVRLFVDDLPTYIDRALPEDLVHGWDELYAKNVKNQKPMHWSKYLASNAKIHYDRSDSAYYEDNTTEDLSEKILDIALDAGLSEDDAEEYVELAERLLEDGRYSSVAVESAIVQKVLASKKRSK